MVATHNKRNIKIITQKFTKKLKIKKFDSSKSSKNSSRKFLAEVDCIENYKRILKFVKKFCLMQKFSILCL